MANKERAMKTLLSKRSPVMPTSRRLFLKGVCAASAASLCLEQPVLAAETPVVAIFATPDILARAQQALGKYFTLVNGMGHTQVSRGQQVVAVIGIGAPASLAMQAASGSGVIQRAVIIEHGTSDSAFRNTLQSFTPKMNPNQPMLLLNGNYPTERALWARTALFLNFATRPGAASTSTLLNRYVAQQASQAQGANGNQSVPTINNGQKRRR
jgi:hypothetical protein